jgi:polyhydroxyalkanoate synthase
MGQAQQMLMEQVAESIVNMPAGATMPSIIGPVFADPTKLADQQSELIKASLGLFGELIEGNPGAGAASDRRFKGEQWRTTPRG